MTLTANWLDNAPPILLFTGKGGVGKTSLSCASAIRLTDEGKRVLLVRTDPASNIDEVLDTPLAGDPRPVKGVPGLEALNIDPLEAAARYRARVVDPLRGILPDEALRNIEEQLSRDCTVEIAAFNEFTRLIGDPETLENYDHIVLDTAPTGHTLLLLDASEAYHREVLRDKGELPESVKTLLPKLRNPAFTRVLLVTLPEATPVHEAQRLQVDLRRAEIEPRAWILNQSLAGASPADPRLRLQAHRETAFLEEARGLSKQLILIPWQAREPVGAEALDGLLK